MENEIKVILNHFKSGDYVNTIKKAKQLSKKNPQNFFLKNLIGSAFLQTGNLKEAIINFKLSIELSPTNIAALNNLANSYKRIGEYKLAETYYLKTLDLNEKYINGLVNYANLKILLNEINAAIELLKKALSINTNNYIAHYNLATAYQTIGKYSDALNHAELTIKTNPTFAPADKLISALTKYNNKNVHLLDMESKLNNKNTNEIDKVYLNFGIAKAYEDLKDFDKFIKHIKKGNDIRKKIFQYNVKTDIILMNKIKLIFKDINYLDFKLKDPEKNIIFILGMPRSGSSLLQKMLSAHQKILGAGELPFLQQILSKEILDNFHLAGSFSSLENFANDYVKKISVFKGNEDFIIDKNPLNFLYAGFIKIFLPNAKIIHIKRNSKDNCFSCYKELFENLNFTDTQEDLLKFYNSYSDLMSFWNQNLKDFIHTISYEDLIIDPKSSIQKVLNFCDLDFDKRCLDFDKNNSPIQTMSVMQARKPIYKSSINSYKKYENDLSYLFDNLAKKKAP